MDRTAEIVNAILNGRTIDEVLSWRKSYEKLLDKASRLQCNVLVLTGDLSVDLKCPFLVLQRILSFLDELSNYKKNKKGAVFNPGLLSYIAKIGLPSPDVVASVMETQKSTVSFTDYESCLDYLNFAEDFAEVDGDALSKLIIKLSQLSYLYPVGEPLESVDDLLANPWKYIGSIYRQAVLLQTYKQNFDRCCIKTQFGYSPIVPVAPVPILLSNRIIRMLMDMLPDVPVDVLNKLLKYGYHLFAGRLAGIEVSELDSVRRIDTDFPVGYGVNIDSDCVRFIFDTSGASYCIELSGRMPVSEALNKIEATISEFSDKVYNLLRKFERVADFSMAVLRGVVAVRDGEGNYYEVLLGDLISALFPAKTFQKSVDKFLAEKSFSAGHLKRFFKNLVGGRLVSIPRERMIDFVSLLSTLELKFGVIGNYPLSPYFSNREALWAYNLLLHRIRRRIGEMNFNLMHRLLHKLVSVLSSRDLKAYLSSDFPGFVRIELYARLPVLVRDKTQWLYEKRWYHISLSGLPPFSKISMDDAIPELSSAPASTSHNVSLQAAATWSGLDFSKLRESFKVLLSYFDTVQHVLSQVDQIPVLFRLKLSKGETFSFVDLGDLVVKIHQ